MTNFIFTFVICITPFQQNNTSSSATPNDPELKAGIEAMINQSIEKADKPQPKAKPGIPNFNIPIPSMIVGYQQHGKPIRIGAAGVRKWDSQETVTPDDLVHIGSCTKAMTATLVGRLVDQKKLSFGTTISQGLPHLADKIHDDYHDVTLHQLLTHRAGIPRDAFWSGHVDKPIVERRNLIVADALSKKPKKPIDGNFEYSNLGYCIAGMIAAKSENTSWESLIQREIFDVLEMKSASFGPPGTKDKLDQPWGHLPLGKKLLPRQGDNPAALGPAGTVHLTMTDWAKFALAHAGCSDPPIVSDTTLNTLHAIVKQNDDDKNSYACGWIVAERAWARGTALTHSGSNTLWYATVWVAPNNDSVYLAAVNAGLNQGILKSVDDAISFAINTQRKAYEKERNQK